MSHVASHSALGIYLNKLAIFNIKLEINESAWQGENAKVYNELSIQIKKETQIMVCDIIQLWAMRQIR